MPEALNVALWHAKAARLLRRDLDENGVWMNQQGKMSSLYEFETFTKSFPGSIVRSIRLAKNNAGEHATNTQYFLEYRAVTTRVAQRSFDLLSNSSVEI